MRTWLRIVGLLACGLTAAWARRPGDPIKPGFNLYSKFTDIQIGQAAALQVQQQYRVVNDAFLQDYIKRCGERLAAMPEARQAGFSFSFTTLNVPQVNAFALPGGPMFIFTGLLNATENEAQLMGVLAHEMSHVILRHGTHEASKAKLVNFSAMLAGAAAGNGSAAGQLARMGLGLGGNSLILKFSRDAETEADLLGSHLMSEAGHNPIEMARFFEKLAANGNQGLQFFSDHPSPDNRERAIEEEIRGLPQRDYTTQVGDFARARTTAALLLTGGVPARSPVPLSSFAPAAWDAFRGPRYSLAYPREWKAESDGTTSGLRIAPPEAIGPAADGAVRITSGALVGYFSPSFGRNDLSVATLELVAFLHGDSPGLQQTSAPQRNVRLNGAEGLLTTLVNRSSKGGAEADVLFTMLRPQGVFYVLCLAPQPDFPRLQQVFQQMLSSVRFNE
jgi:beta-barrel assembly-enhancing protease